MGSLKTSTVSDKTVNASDCLRKYIFEVVKLHILHQP